MARSKRIINQSSRGKKGNKKHGHNKDKCKRYRDRGTREKNKARKAEKRERRYARNKVRGMSTFQDGGPSV